MRRHEIISEGEHSMNYTKNYRLPQWVKEDRIMMDDFNAMNSSIENGLTKTAAQAARAEQSAQNAESSAASAYSPGNKPYVVGTYTGTGEYLAIDVGFRPSILIISGLRDTLSALGTEYFMDYACIATGNSYPRGLVLTDTGFAAKARTASETYTPFFTASGRKYTYIAFK